MKRRIILGNEIDVATVAASAALFWSQVGSATHPVLVAVSGGTDSMVLLHALIEQATSAPPAIHVGHVNHQLRGEESDLEESFVAQVCADWSIPCHRCRVETAEIESHAGSGVEAAARKARYRALERMASDHGCRYLATAHSRDDQIETVLHRILRGTGMRGLAGMPRVRPINTQLSLVRPLLDVNRSSILAYAEQHKVPFVVDSTNAELNFTRNRIRRELLPMLRRSFNPDVDGALQRLCELAQAHQSVFEPWLNEQLESCLVQRDPHRAVIDTNRLPEPEIIVGEILRALWRNQSWPQQHMSRNRWTDLTKLACTAKVDQPKQLTLPDEMRAILEQGQLVIWRQIAL